jgi:cell division protein FtsW
MSLAQSVARKGVDGAKRLATKSGVGPVDGVLAAAVIALVGFGVVMVYSASAFEATVKFNDAQYFLKRQGTYAVLALAVMWLGSRFDYRLLRPLTYPALLLVAVLMIATVVGFGHRAGNAYRWLVVGPVHIQPSETAKVAIVLWLAYSLSKKGDTIRKFTVGFLPHLLVTGFFMLLCLKQPDFGSAVVLLLLTLVMLLTAGVRLPHFLLITSGATIAAAALIRFSAYRWGRFMSWMNMDEHRQGLAYQPFQSVMSFGSGGLFGLGLGKGLQVLYLPEAHTDFVAAIVGEELGFVGLMGLCGCYVLIVARGIRVALHAADDYGAYIAFGLSAMLGMQVLLNLAVAMAILPTKGLTLPFVSYGGSSLLVSAGAMGILLNISRRRPDLPKPAKVEGPAESATAVVAASVAEPASEEAA